MTIITIILIISIISNIIVYDLPFKIQRYTSKNKVIRCLLYIIYKVFTCVNCLSYHMTWITFVILWSSPMGFIYGFITYLLSSIVDRLLHTTSF